MTDGRPNRWSPGKKRGERDSYPPAVVDANVPIPLTEIRGWLLCESHRVRLEDHLDWYLRFYDGRFFEQYHRRTKSPLFGPWDVLAVEMLSVTVPPAAIDWLLRPDAIRDELLIKINQFLIDGRDTLWTCDASLLEGRREDFTEGGELFHLYYILRENGIGPVTTSKLLAAKFPALVPIRDSKVAHLLGMDDDANWWQAIRSLFNSDGPSLAQHLDGLALPQGVDPITTLRRLDIVLWMEAQARRIDTRK